MTPKNRTSPCRVGNEGGSWIRAVQALNACNNCACLMLCRVRVNAGRYIFLRHRAHDDQRVPK
eukprot:14645393-Alexandrium_andersonii.AAC.1